MATDDTGPKDAESNDAESTDDSSGSADAASSANKSAAADAASGDSEAGKASADKPADAATTGDTAADKPAAADSADKSAAADATGDSEAGKAADEPVDDADAATGDSEAGKAAADKPAAVPLDKAGAKPSSAAADADPAAESPSDQPSAAPAKAASGRSAKVAIVAAAVTGILLVAAVTALVVFFMKANSQGDELDARAEATAAACEYGKLISTYDAESMDEYLKNVAAASTGDWKADFTKLGQDLKAVVIDAKASSSTYDVQCGFQSGDEDSAQILVVIGQTNSNVNTIEAGQPPAQVELVVVAGLEKQGDKWLVNRFDLPILKQLGGS